MISGLTVVARDSSHELSFLAASRAGAWKTLALQRRQHGLDVVRVALPRDHRQRRRRPRDHPRRRRQLQVSTPQLSGEHQRVTQSGVLQSQQLVELVRSGCSLTL